MSVHRLMMAGLATPRQGDVVAVEGEEARHALRVKRVGVGDGVEILDGQGMIARGVLVEGDRRVLTVRIDGVDRVERVSPRVEVVAAAPKGGRVDDMVRGLSQVGAAAWIGLRSERTVVEPRPAKLDRLRAIALEAAKQCGRAWTLEIGNSTTFESALDGEVMLADASGDAYEPAEAPEMRLLIGPEGGWSERELNLARERGARVCSFGVHVMRIEVAAVVAAGIVMNAANRLR